MNFNKISFESLLLSPLALSVLGFIFILFMANLPMQIAEQTRVTVSFYVSILWTFTFFFYLFWFISKIFTSSSFAALVSLVLCVLIIVSVATYDATTKNKDPLSSSTLLVLLPGLIATGMVDNFSFKSFSIDPLTCPLADLFDHRNKIEIESMRWSILADDPVAIIQLRHDSIKNYRATRAFVLKLNASGQTSEESLVLKTNTDMNLKWPHFKSREQMLAVDTKVDSFLKNQTDLFQLRGLWLHNQNNTITALSVEYSNSNEKPETLWKSWNDFLTEDAKVIHQENGLVDPGSTRSTTWGNFNSQGDQFIYGSQIDKSSGIARNEILIHFKKETSIWKTVTVQTHVADDLTLSPIGAYFDKNYAAYTLAFDNIDSAVHIVSGFTFPLKNNFTLQIPIQKQVSYDALAEVHLLNDSKVLITLPYADFQIFNLNEKKIDTAFWQNVKTSLNIGDNKFGNDPFYHLEMTPTKMLPFFIVRKKEGLFLLDNEGHLKTKWSSTN